MSNKVDNFLKHYGILGMKWGVRKGRQANGRKTALAKFNKGLAKLKSQGRENDIKAVVALSKQYDIDRKNAKVAKKKAVQKAKETHRKTNPQEYEYTSKIEKRVRRKHGRAINNYVKARVEKGDSVKVAIRKGVGIKYASRIAILATIKFARYRRTAAYKSNKAAGKRYAEDIFMKSTGRNIVKRDGTIILNPKKYRSF